MSLEHKTCEACRADAPRVEGDALLHYLEQVPQWTLIDESTEAKLSRVYTFADFATAWFFVDKVAALAEAEDHHPKLILEWGKVEVCWWTHKITGLHQNDFICAAKTDRIFAQSTDTES